LSFFRHSECPFIAATAKELSEAIPNAQYYELEGQTHDVNAQVLAPVLLEFLPRNNRESKVWKRERPLDFKRRSLCVLGICADFYSLPWIFQSLQDEQDKEEE
jgi:hypothetical protein